MVERNTPNNDESGRNSNTGSSGKMTRRNVLKTATAGAAAFTVGSSVVGNAAAVGIPTPALERDGNKLVDPSCNDVILRGINMPDPVRLQRSWRTKDAMDVIDLALDTDAGWHNHIIRIPHQPQDITAAGNSNFTHAHGDDWGPLLPGQFDESDMESYFGTYVDPLVDELKTRGAYAMLDYHRHFPIFHQPQNEDAIGEYQCGESSFEHDLGFCGERGMMWNSADQASKLKSMGEEEGVLTPEGEPVFAEQEYAEKLDAEIKMFWEFVADRYADEPHVIFDIYNEPTGPYAGDWGAPDRLPSAGESGDQNFDPDTSYAEEFYKMWQQRAQPWVDVVEENAPGSVKTIGSPRWSQYTYWADEYEFEATNMCYTGHAYMQDGLRPLSKFYGKPAENVPVFFSEWGWSDGGGPDDFAFLDGVTSEAAPGFKDLFDNHPVHPIAWNFDHTWAPAFFKDSGKTSGNWELRDYEVGPGQWWKEYMANHKDDDLPTDDPAEECNTTTPPTTSPPTTEPPTTSPPPSGATVSVDVSGTASVDSTVDASITLSEAPDGLAGYKITVGVADASVASVSGASYPDSLGLTETQVASDGSSATIKAVDVQDNITGGATNVELATVSLSAEANGETDITLVVESLDNDQGGLVQPMTAGGTLVVSSGPTVNGVTAQDPDGDGKYEDLNANGRVDSDDVVTYFEHKDGDVAANVDAFDYNENGRIDFDDVTTLFDEV